MLRRKWANDRRGRPTSYGPDRCAEITKWMRAGYTRRTSRPGSIRGFHSLVHRKSRASEGVGRWTWRTCSLAEKLGVVVVKITHTDPTAVPLSGS